MKPLIDECAYTIAEMILRDFAIKSVKDRQRVWEMLYRRIHMMLGNIPAESGFVVV
jgi:hypothetical protein